MTRVIAPPESPARSLHGYVASSAEWNSSAFVSSTRAWRRLAGNAGPEYSYAHCSTSASISVAAASKASCRARSSVCSSVVSPLNASAPPRRPIPLCQKKAGQLARGQDARKCSLTLGGPLLIHDQKIACLVAGSDYVSGPPGCVAQQLDGMRRRGIFLQLWQHRLALPKTTNNPPCDSSDVGGRCPGARPIDKEDGLDGFGGTV